MADTTDARIGLMTAPDAEVAERLVRELVDERLVACGNIVDGLTSVYRWQGAVECDPEVMIVLKTMADAVPRLVERARELHPYDVPEILIVPVAAGHGPYLSWMAENVAVESTKS